jgi:hypothetical protein
MLANNVPIFKETLTSLPPKERQGGYYNQNIEAKIISWGVGDSS